MAINKSFYREAIIRDSPEYYWRFGETSGTTAFDEIGGKNLVYTSPFLLSRPSLISNDKDDSAVKFTGDAGFASTTPGVLQDKIDFDYTIEMWIHVTATEGFGGTLWKNGGHQAILADSSPSVVSWETPGHSIADSTSISINTTYQLVFVRDRDTDCNEKLAIYINGELASKTTIVNCLRGSNTDFSIGGDGNGILIDEVSVYHTALSSQKIRNHYYAAFQNKAVGMPGVGPEYGGLPLGGQWYYSHNTPGTDWFDKVDNGKGWTVDFNLKINEIINTDWALSEDERKGIGIYVNDGVRREYINFLMQEINFSETNTNITFDATAETNYRLLGKGDNIRLFAKKTTDDKYFQIANNIFPKISINSGNGYKPALFQDVDGAVHVVWYDDGNGTGQIYYSKFVNGIWLDPELVVDDSQGARNPDILVDNDGLVYLAYESQIAENAVIALVYKTNLGWSQPFYVGVADGAVKHPKITFDSQFNICVIWEDHRLTHPEIYLSRFIKNLQKFDEEIRLTTTDYGALNPSVSSYLDDIFVSFTVRQKTERTYISLLKHNVLSNITIGPNIFSDLNLLADYSDILVNLNGKVFVTYQDRSTGKFEIYLHVFALDLRHISGRRKVTNSRGGANFPVLSEQQTTGDVYVVWHDYKTGDFREFEPLKFSENEYGVTELEYEAIQETQEPLDSAIYIAYYNNVGDFLLSSKEGPYDVILHFPFDNRTPQYPSVPPVFDGDLVIVYESLLGDTSSFIPAGKFFSQIRAAFYDLSRDKQEYVVTPGAFPTLNPSFDLVNRDMDITGRELKKEIRFGDFSTLLNGDMIFKNFKYYASDAVEPFDIVEINSNNFPVKELTAYDAAINNYGDVWIVGTCGMLFYINNQNRLVLLEETDGAELKGPIGNVKAISFDKHGYMYVGNETGIYISTEHVNGFIKIISIVDVTAISFDDDNNLLVGTGSIGAVGITNGTFSIYSIVDNSFADSNNPVLVSLLDSSGDTGSVLPNEFITSIQVDDNNVVWICTYNGLFRLFRNQIIKFDTKNGFISNRINDIAIRNTAIRYVATSGGILKMIGSNIDQLIRSNDERLWNSNVKCVMWQDPNVLWAGTLSKVNQILVNDFDRSYRTVIYEPDATLATQKNDLRTYYIINDDSEQTIEKSDIVEATINGNLVDKETFIVGFDAVTGQKIIRFNTPLKNDDVVEVLVRKDLLIKADFKQTPEEKSVAGDKLIRIKDLSVAGDLLYLVTEGSENEVKVNDSDNKLPFDRVHLDTTPPLGALSIIEQIDRSLVKLNVDITSAGLGDGPTGSGIDRMVISNFSNFTTDGSSAQVPVPFSSTIIHDIGLSLEESSTTLKLGSLTGSGLTIEYFSEINQLYAGTSNPAKLFNFNFSTQTWQEIFSYSNGESVDFITRFNNLLIVSVGHSSNPARLFIYDIKFSGTAFDKLEVSDIIGLSESRASAFQELDNVLYIGAGIGTGDEYGLSTGLGGKIYSYDGLVISELITGLDENVFGLVQVEGSPNLVAVTGGSGFVYEVDIDNKSAFIIFNDIDSLISINTVKVGGKSLIFVGNGNKGIIRRSEVDTSSFDVSIQTLLGSVNAIKVFKIENKDVLYASIGKVLYFLSDSGSWVWRHTHIEEIKDIAFNPGTKDIYIISDSRIGQIKAITTGKCVYLKLIDRAGNESIFDKTLDTEQNPFVDCVTIDSLRDFVNENKLFELNSSGEVVFNLRGNSAFYSGKKINQETGIFTSEIFNGSNDLVQWQTISWNATELTETQVLVYVRSSSSKNDILLEDWIGPFANEKSGGIDISYLSGQFMQFRVDLISNRKDVTPSFHSANVVSITSEAVHFFTTNFILPSNITSGILTSRKIIPVSADIVFALNTTNSIDFSDYQIIEEDRLFNLNQFGENLRVGIKLISPTRGEFLPTGFGEYGPYDTDLFINTINFTFTNKDNIAKDFHFRVILFEDFSFQRPVVEIFSFESQAGFSIQGEKLGTSGYNIGSREEVSVLVNVPGNPLIQCDEFYFVKIEATSDSGDTFELIQKGKSFVSGCTTSFVDIIDFDFTNESFSDDFHFRVRFYNDPERTDLLLTEFSGNDRTGWFIDDVKISEAGKNIISGETVNVVFRPDLTKFESNTTIYLTIEAYDGNRFLLASNSFTFQARDVQSLVYCGAYSDVPIVKNFALIFELDNNELVTLNL